MSENPSYLHLVEHMGGDLAVVNSARVSYGKSSVELNDRDKALIRSLLRNRHGTPFEQAVFTFYVRCPIFVMREWIRHRIGSFNEISGRYTKLKTEFYTPKNFRQMVPDSKQMEYKYRSAPPEINDQAREAVLDFHRKVAGLYDWLTNPVAPTKEERADGVTPGLGIAKEHARIVLPVSIFTEFRWTVNARALMNFCSLRNSPHAMAEIRSYAKIVEAHFERCMPVTYAAFVENNRMAP